MRSDRKELRYAAGLVRQAILARYQPETEDVGFSCEFEQELIAINSEAHRRERFVKVRRGALAVILTVLLCGSLFLVSNPTAMAALREWAIDICEHSVIFHFISDPAYTGSAELPEYAPLWMPDGMELAGKKENEAIHSEMYTDGSGNLVTIDYSFADYATSVLYENTDGTAVQLEKITVHGFPGFYIPPDEYGQSNVIWVENNMVFTVDGSFGKQEMLKIAESLVLVNTHR